MPELPEVETIVRQLASSLPGLQIREARVTHAHLLRPSEDVFSRNLPGQEIRSVSRRGKNIVISLSSPRILLVNLGMTGRLLHRRENDPHPWPSHEAVSFPLKPSGTLVYDDVRRFGLLQLLSLEDWALASSRLGPEPLEEALTATIFYESLQRSRSPIRSWFLDQRRMAGVGNIYANEALFRGGIHPRRPANSLDRRDAKILLTELRSVLREAIRAQGTTLRDYRTAQGEEGNFGRALRVYGRDGFPCPRCKTPVRRTVFGNRSAFFCPQCQPEEL